MCKLTIFDLLSDHTSLQVFGDCFASKPDVQPAPLFAGNIQQPRKWFYADCNFSKINNWIK